MTTESRLPIPSFTVSFTVYVPGEVYRLAGFGSVELFPFPRSQRYDAAPVDVLVNCTLRGVQPVCWSEVKDAEGAA